MCLACIGAAASACARRPVLSFAYTFAHSRRRLRPFGLGGGCVFFAVVGFILSNGCGAALAVVASAFLLMCYVWRLRPWLWPFGFGFGFGGGCVRPWRPFGGLGGCQGSAARLFGCFGVLRLRLCFGFSRLRLRRGCFRLFRFGVIFIEQCLNITVKAYHRLPILSTRLLSSKGQRQAGGKGTFYAYIKEARFFRRSFAQPKQNITRMLSFCNKQA